MDARLKSRRRRHRHGFGMGGSRGHPGAAVRPAQTPA